MSKKGLRLIPTEDEEQTWLFSWAKISAIKYPELDLMYHIPNGGMRKKSEAVRFRAMGVKSGVPDICLPVARGGYHGMYIELKALDGRPSENQNTWLSALEKQGYYAVVIYGGDSAAQVIADYLDGRLHREKN